MVENFPNFARNTNLQIQEADKTPKKINTQKSTLRHSIVQLLKTKKKIFKIVKQKQQFIYKGKINSNNSGFLIRNHKGQKEVPQFLNAERKTLSIKNTISRDNIFRTKEGN